jgi:hypothetical protein
MDYHFSRGCEECGRSVDIDDNVCSKCGFDFTLNPRVSPKCPYCEKELHLHDFYLLKTDKKGRKAIAGILGESFGYSNMFHCPFCGKILGFTNAGYT